MKPRKKIGKMLLIAIVVLTVSSDLFAQGNSNGLWQAKGSDTVTTNREVLIQKNLKVQGKVTAENAYVLKQLKIGVNSMWLGQTSTTGLDEIKSTSSQIAFGGTNAAGTLFYDNIKIGINTQTPFIFDPSLNGLDVRGDINIVFSNNTDDYRNHGYRIRGVTVQQTQFANIFAFVN